MSCPICGSEAQDLGSRDYGDKDSYDCVRCGKFEISGTAKAMLPNRFHGTMHYARVSHALRTMPQKGDELFMVTSANLDDLASKTLPDPKTQIQNLLKWVSGHLGEDRFGAINCPKGNVLAGIVGTIDGKSADTLLRHAQNANLIELSLGAKLIGLTFDGWNELEITASTEDALKSTPATLSLPEVDIEEMIVKANCNVCGGKRNSYVRASYCISDSDHDVSWSDTIKTLQCCGCDTLSVEHEHWFSEWDDFGYDPLSGEEIHIPGVKTTMWPPLSVRDKPDWADRLDDAVLRSVLDEVYTALDHGLLVVAAIGARTLLDRAMFLRVNDQPGGFPGKLDAMVKASRMGADEKVTFLAITDVGNAAAHRGYAPKKKTLDAVFTATENFLHREFILPVDAEIARKETPSKKEK